MTKLLRLREEDREALHHIHKTITSNPLHNFTLTEFAANAGINKTKLTYGFKAMFGLGVYEYQLTLRMEKAEFLLIETDKDMKQIAAITGYKTKSSFTVAFKKKHGLAPLQWRQKHRPVKSAGNFSPMLYKIPH